MKKETSRKLKLNKNPKVFLLLLGFLCLMQINCHQTIQGIEGENAFFKFDDVTFKMSQTSQAANTYWIKSGEEIFIEWESIGILYDLENQMCTFENYQNTEGCSFCDGCGNGVGCNPRLTNSPYLKMSFEPDFIKTDQHQMLDDLQVDIRSGCRINSDEPISFIPEESGLYFLTGKGLIYNGATNGEIKIKVAGTDQNPTQTATFDLRKERIEGTDFWRWEVTGSPLWTDNFSENVRIVKIRILEDDEEIRPSRILFLPNFMGSISAHPQERNNRCYIDTNSLDDDSIDFNNCRKIYGQNLQPQDIESKDATPTFQHSQPTDKLSWFVEFNTIEGADDARNATDLKIEFMIESFN